MNRRTILQTGLATLFGAPLLAAIRRERIDDAAEILTRATSTRLVASAVLHVVQKESSDTLHFGQAASNDSMFLLGSISKPICMTALMTLFDRGLFRLNDPVQKFIADFSDDGRDQVTIQHLLTHVSGLPDQVPENNLLRSQHADLSEFVAHAIRTPLQFAPGSKYQYSSMGILLALEVARRISGTGMLDLVQRTVLQPLGMKHSAIGLGSFTLADMILCQTEFGAPESGAGDPAAKDWDWNSPYWRKLGAPWGGVHASAPDLGRFLREFLEARGTILKPETAKLMIRNHNLPEMMPRGLGFNVGTGTSSPGCSMLTFGHTGSTGTIAWADPATDTICVVLTSLPARAVQPHPRDLVSSQIAAAAR